MRAGRWVVPALALAYAGAAALYGWQAWGQATPWIFPDETLHARAAQAIAGIGTGSIPLSGSLTAIVTAPAWLFGDPVTAYGVAKLIGVFVMCLVIVPAYLLARLFVGRLPAFLAAVASVAIPGMSYSSLLMQEPIAYPYSTLVLYALARGLVRESRRGLVIAFVLALIGPLIRPELVVLPIAVVLAVLLWIWFGDWAGRKRQGWGPWHWTAAAAVLVAVLFAAAALGAAASVAWRTALQNPDDIIRYAALALGPFAAGVAILPVLAAPAVIVRRGAFAYVFAAAFAGFLVYVGAKEAFLSTQQGFPTINDLLGERNLIYLSPLVFAATAIWADRRRINMWALAGATAVLVGVFAWIPYVWAEESAPSSPTVVSISRIVGALSRPGVRGALIVATVAAALVLLSRSTAVFAAVALVVVGWSLTGAINAGNRSHEIGAALADAQPRPLDWIDRATGGQPAVYVGQAKLRPPEILSLAFWNNSLTRLVTLGGEPVYGLIFETKIASGDGRLSDPKRARYVVSDREVDVAGRRVASGKRWNVERVDGPVRLDAFQAGIWQDGWMEDSSAYTRFAPRSGRPGHVRVGLSQKAGCNPAIDPVAEIRVVELTRQRVTTIRRPLPACGETAVTVRVPPPPFAVRTRISPTFVPAEIFRGSTDSRHLGAQVTYRYEP